MHSFFVSLSSVQDVKQFVNTATRYPFAIDVHCGDHLISAKSIMALFALDLSKPLHIEVMGSDEEIASFQAELSSFVVSSSLS